MVGPRPLWLRLWLAIFLATAIPIMVFLALGVVLAARSAEQADLHSLERQTRLLGAILEKQSTSDRGTIQDAVASIGRRLEILTRPQTAALLPSADARRLRSEGGASGTLVAAGGRYLYAAELHRGEVILLMRPYEAPLFDWRPWMGSIALGASLAAVCAVIASALVARAITRPVARVAAASHALASGGAPPRLRLEGPQELRSLAATFNEMADQLARAKQAERSFLLSVSHELKTPVSAIRGFAEGEKEGVISPEEASEFVLGESDRLERLVQDLLDMARLDQRHFEVRLEQVDLAALAREAANRLDATARSLDVELVVSAEEPALALADPDRLLQVLSNLIENALRYSPVGRRVSIRAVPGRVDVADAGPGLAAEDITRAFERFYLYRRYRQDRPVGTGLGLTLVKELTEAMGGTVALESEPGKGAVFSVRLAHAEP